MTRKICVITGTRAEYGLLRRLMNGIQADPALTLQVIATGMHLSPEYGLTYQTIEQDGFTIDHKLEMLLSSDTPSGIAKSMGLGVIGFADAFATLSPDLVVLLGDRFEIFAAASAALVARLPIAHLHGGELTEGAFDDAIRHAITKMSHLHFVSHEDYRRRVIQLGEQPARVFQVGGLGVDCIKHLKLLERHELEKMLGIRFGANNLLITFHPVTLDQQASEEQMNELLAALSSLQDTVLIFTYPNSDTDSRILINMIDHFVGQHPNAHAFTSLGQLRYLSCVALVDGVIGNSSSGLAEVPSLHKGTVNIGDRQQGRLHASSVINCSPDRNQIRKAIAKLYSSEFQSSLAEVQNPYGDGGASERILSTIKDIPLENLIKKSFYDYNSAN